MRIILPSINNDVPAKIEVIALSELSSEQMKEASRSNLNSNENSPVFVYNGPKINPNIADFEELRACGLSKFASENIIKYRNSGGYFNDMDDVKKIYGIDSITLIRLKEVFKFEVAATPQTDIQVKKHSAETLIVELNSADSLALIPVPGIGNVLAARIIKYRNQLGGYTSMDQLTEVYGITQEKLDKLRLHLKIDLSLIRKIDLNTMKEFELAKHPYLTNYQAKAIVKLRQSKGTSITTEDLILNNILNEEELEKLIFYIQ